MYSIDEYRNFGVTEKIAEIPYFCAMEPSIFAQVARGLGLDVTNEYHCQLVSALINSCRHETTDWDNVWPNPMEYGFADYDEAKREYNSRIIDLVFEIIELPVEWMREDANHISGGNWTFPGNLGDCIVAEIDKEEDDEHEGSHASNRGRRFF